MIMPTRPRRTDAKYIKQRLKELTAERASVLEVDVPLPGISPGGRPLSVLGKLVRAMKPGHSLLVETQALADRARYIGRSLDYKTIQRTQPDGRVRVWRLE